MGSQIGYNLTQTFVFCMKLKILSNCKHCSLLLKGDIYTKLIFCIKLASRIGFYSVFATYIVKVALPTLTTIANFGTVRAVIEQYKDIFLK